MDIIVVEERPGCLDWDAQPSIFLVQRSQVKLMDEESDADSVTPNERDADGGAFWSRFV